MTGTSIRISSDVRDRLRAEKQGGESYDDVLDRLLSPDYDSAAEMLADVTGRPKEEFEPDFDKYPIPDRNDLERVYPNDEE